MPVAYSTVIGRNVGRIVSAMCLFTVPLPAVAQSRPPYPLWKIDSLQSKILGETRAVLIAPPSDYDRAWRATERFPVLIVLDALDDDILAATIASARVLGGLTTPVIPPLLVVGVETERNRYRDMAPPAPVGRAADTGGHAPNFAAFLETELLPFISARYRTLPFTIVAGHSLSGLFAAYVYGQSPGFVNAAIAMSPSLIWDNGEGVQLVANGIRARTNRGRLFVATGTAELDLDSAASRLAAEMRSKPGSSTSFEHHHLAEDTHFTSPLQGMIDGLRFIFRPITLADRPPAVIHKESAVVGPEGVLLPSSEDVLAAYRNVRRDYAAGARELGLPERLPPFFGFGLGQWLASSKRVDAAKTICQDVVDSHPDNWLGYDCLAQAQRALKDSSGAATSYQKALELVERSGDAEVVARLQRGLKSVLPRSPPNPIPQETQ